MYDLDTRKRALTLVAQGCSQNSVSKQTGISRAAIRSWLKRIEPLGYSRGLECPRCGDTPKPPDDPAAYSYLLGLYLGDGCRIINWTTRLVGGERKRYEYPRYFFTIKSDDIRKLFSDTLTAVGVEWTTLARGSDPFNISVARRASVALMDAHVGPKY